MPNGRGSPQCYNCDFYTTSQDARNCRKHNFVMPTITSEVLCNDWKHAGSRKPFPSLSPGFLYYYSYASQNRPEPLYHFDQLQQQLIFSSVWLSKDQEYGWAIHLNQYDYKNFPGPGEQVTIGVDEKELQMNVIDVERDQRRGSSRNAEDKWETRYERGIQRLIFAPSSPGVVYEWLDGIFNLDAIISEYEKRSREIPIPTWLYFFIEINPKLGTFKLRPNLVHYADFQRGKYHPVFYRIKNIARGIKFHFLIKQQVWKLKIMNMFSKRS